MCMFCKWVGAVARGSQLCCWVRLVKRVGLHVKLQIHFDSGWVLMQDCAWWLRSDCCRRGAGGQRGLDVEGGGMTGCYQASNSDKEASKNSVMIEERCEMLLRLRI